jgi:hypothetical protein
MTMDSMTLTVRQQYAGAKSMIQLVYNDVLFPYCSPYCRRTVAILCVRLFGHRSRIEGFLPKGARSIANGQMYTIRAAKKVQSANFSRDITRWTAAFADGRSGEHKRLCVPQSVCVSVCLFLCLCRTE